MILDDDYLLDEVDDCFEDVMAEVLGDLNIDTYSSSDWDG